MYDDQLLFIISNGDVECITDIRPDDTNAVFGNNPIIGGREVACECDDCHSPMDWDGTYFVCSYCGNRIEGERLNDFRPL